MKINQAEELAGITKKNIRFYEEQGLLNPKRNPENGYREYNLEDVNRLLRIKLFRKLGVSIEDIRLLFDDRMSLSECMEKHLNYLEQQKDNLEIMKQMCVEMKNLPDSAVQIDANEYLEKMDKLETKGVYFIDIEKKDINRKKIGPLIAAIVMILLFLFTIAIFVWADVVSPIPIWMMAILIITMAFPIVGVTIALYLRFKEIDGGEEDEASKY